jgi:hypothetical protein
MSTNLCLMGFEEFDRRFRFTILKHLAIPIQQLLQNNVSNRWRIYRESGGNNPEQFKQLDLGYIGEFIEGQLFCIFTKMKNNNKNYKGDRYTKYGELPSFKFQQYYWTIVKDIAMEMKIDNKVSKVNKRFNEFMSYCHSVEVPLITVHS